MNVERFPRRCEHCGVLRTVVKDGDGWAMLPCAQSCLGSIGTHITVPLRRADGAVLTEEFRRVAGPDGYVWQAMGFGP